ncbi:lysine methyltransferase [Trichoderma sp. SZMC 28012]
MFYESEIPGKRIGLIAKRLIRKGETVMKRQPSLLVQVETQARTDVHVRYILYGQAMDGMRDLDRSRIDKNCFRLHINDDENNNSGDHYIGCYPDIARLNHDCRPSLAYIINNFTHTVSAVRDIDAGEELSNSYIRLLSPRAQRLAQLKHWGFNCSCAHCTMSNQDAATSDVHLRAILGLERDLDNFKETLVMPETETALLHLYLSRAYAQAAINYATFGREDESNEYARLALERLGIEPVSNAEHVVLMTLLSERPRLHGAWEACLNAIK